ncbi:hypothetical protein [Pragia fontium]|uniref:Uncharacterized protein n=1 Tax=Pragia fontium DSM 5563 = ATCC 49100 TaxID=1122977 RepID=A0AAJ4WAM8_9GAMM|nr:hypothetical protein [Pragia fontium]SFC85708.1 hypothetical protein SAMN02745723_1052 [Pragia fontium DSM 5563 = ATCC 49100]SUB83232.1 Uncharacterised protein [Pragia fontium]VEJ56127.1 Uncharacterised protein [Pragia fontium]
MKEIELHHGKKAVGGCLIWKLICWKPCRPCKPKPPCGGGNGGGTGPR